MTPTSRRPASQPLGTKVLDALSSVWLGIIWAALLFVYCSIGSAIPAVRQHPSLEMTEFEWFHWWPFNLLIVLFCTTLILATVRRIPLRLVNAGVWMIHAGIIILCAGSYWYFSTKVEGDAPVFRRRVTINMPGMKAPVEMVAVPGSEKIVPVGPDNWHFEVQSTNTDWPILSDEDKGKKAYAVNVMVRPPTGEPFVRQLLDGFPQYTEDVMPGKGRAIKNIGRKLVDEDLQLSLDYHPTTDFSVMDTWALFIRKVGDTQWQQREIDGLPRYNDRISSRDQVFSDPHDPLTLRPIDLDVPAGPEGDALASAGVHITGFLRYAHVDRRWRNAADKLNPVIQLSLVSTQMPSRNYELIAFDPQQSRTPDGNIQFLWLTDRAQVANLPTDSRAVLKISIPGTNVNLDVPITQEQIGGEFTPIESSEFAYRVTGVHDNLALPNQERPVSIVAVEFKTADGTFKRWVANVPELTKDLPGESNDPHATNAKTLDPRVVTTYQPQSPPVIFAAYPGGLHFVFNGPSGRLVGRDVSEGETIQLFDDLSLRVDQFLAQAVAEVKPAIVPASRQEAKVGQTFSMARVEVQTRRGVDTQWLNFNRYVFPDAEYAMGGRFAYSPAVFQTDSGPVEVMLSRKRMPLPHPIGMEDFTLDTHLGGFTGNALTIRNYVSRLRFFESGKWSDPVDIAVNHPTENGGYWYFQSEWDRPESNRPGGGMNFTGLGIGNRHGVHVQLLGCCVAVAGMIFAFYVKPVIKRRRALHSRSRLTSTPHADGEPDVTEMTAESVEVMNL